MIRKSAFALLASALIVVTAAGQVPKAQWVDSVFNTMDVTAKIGQLFMVTATPGQEEETENLLRQIESFRVGGVVLRGGSTADPEGFLRRLQRAADFPLLVAMDGAGSPAAYIDSLFSFPGTLMQGAGANDSLLYAWGKEVGRQMALTGIHVGFIPANIAGRFNTIPGQAYSENPAVVSRKSLAFLDGLRQHDIAGIARYFPVQSMSVTDVTRGLPAIQLTVDSVQASPFRDLFRAGLAGVMPASSNLPLFYPKKKTARRNIFSSGMLSASFAGDWIRRNMGYDGVVMVDVQRMVANEERVRNGDAELFAFRAGNDILITSENVNAAARKIRRLVRRRPEYLTILNESVRKILALKYDAGLFETNDDPEFPLSEQLITSDTRILREHLYRAAITVMANTRNVLPVQTLENKKFTCIIAGDTSKGNAFARQLSKYVPLSVLYVDSGDDSLVIRDPVFGQHVVIAGVFSDADPHAVSVLMPHLKEPTIDRDVIVCDFGAGALRDYLHEFNTVITAWSDDEPAVRNLAQAIFGAMAVDGRVPLAVGGIPAGTSRVTPSLHRLGYSFPEEAGIDSHTLRKIEDIAREAIDMNATPGCQVLVARNGKVVYERAFGHFTYERQNPVLENTIYDLASVTKVAATLQTIMFLYEKGLIDIYSKASAYLPELKGSNKEDFTIKEMLTHQAGLWPYLPFWAQTVDDTVYLPEFYDHRLSRDYSLVVADNLYARPSLRDSLWNWVIRARVREKAARTPYDYRYSDMGFYILYRLAEKLLNQPINDFLYQNFYEPLGATSTGYKPLVRFPISQLAPTENDRLFRRTLLIGTVHDQGAAMMGGVAGHAGLFSNANDLAKLAQMWLQEGAYGGIRYFRPETIRLFSDQQYATNRRGLGWDKPTGDLNGPTGIYASPKTFGHTGFTGTCVWVDPEFDLVYVFLSNRVHPDMTNNKLLSANIRPRIQDVIYEGIFDYRKNQESLAESQVPLIDAMGKLHNKK